MMSWQWVRGEPVLRKLSSLPRYTLTVPQKTGAPAVVPLRCVTDAQKTLGVWSCPAGDFGVHIKEKMEEGSLWVERLRRNRCPAAEAWMGFRYSLIPQLTYGISETGN